MTQLQIMLRTCTIDGKILAGHNFNRPNCHTACLDLLLGSSNVTGSERFRDEYAGRTVTRSKQGVDFFSVKIFFLNI
jgi:hypothetical protein